MIRRFEADTERIARLEHPKVVPVHDAWREPAGAHVVMRLLSGGSLADAVARGRLDSVAAARVIVDAAAGLAAAHRAGLVHADVKPSNVLLDGEGHGYRTDIAIGDTAPGSGDAPRLSLTGRIVLVGDDEMPSVE